MSYMTQVQALVIHSIKNDILTKDQIKILLEKYGCKNVASLATNQLNKFYADLIELRDKNC